MEVLVLYHIGPYFVGIFPYIALTVHRPYIWYLQSRFLKWPLMWTPGSNGTDVLRIVSWHAAMKWCVPYIYIILKFKIYIWKTVIFAYINALSQIMESGLKRKWQDWVDGKLVLMVPHTETVPWSCGGDRGATSENVTAGFYGTEHHCQPCWDLRHPNPL